MKLLTHEPCQPQIWAEPGWSDKKTWTVVLLPTNSLVLIISTNRQRHGHCRTIMIWNKQHLNNMSYHKRPHTHLKIGVTSPSIDVCVPTRYHRSVMWPWGNLDLYHYVRQPNYAYKATALPTGGSTQPLYDNVDWVPSITKRQFSESQ